MALPSIRIQFLNGQLGTVADSQDGLLALVCGAAAVSSTFSLSTAYTVYRLAGLEALGVTETNNAGLYRHVRDFYNEAEEGTPLVVYGVEKTQKMAALCDKDRPVRHYVAMSVVWHIFCFDDSYEIRVFFRFCRIN